VVAASKPNAIKGHAADSSRVLLRLARSWHSQLADDAASAIAVLPPIVAGFWFYSIVLWRLAAAAPLGRSFPQSAGNFYVLFLGNTIWLGFFPPTGDKSALDWGAWVLVISGLVALLIVLSPWR
jgi:hypothetical protein